ncbi:unnamed protein product [Effrenium voratum]|uniref:Protein RFT1 homolog n=1 Tax=Effrenium voratum TaxID=2562239 RepID=A0AA36IE87_9DINO|nr:unnamed protein product [Effrenium voratum]
MEGSMKSEGAPQLFYRIGVGPALALRYPSAKIHSFEPVRRYFDHLSKTFGAYVQSGQVTLYNMGASDKDDKVSFRTDGDLAASSEFGTAKGDEKKPHFEGFPRPTRSMADLLKGIGAVVSTQVLSRAVTFGLNVLVARLASPAAYGLGYVSLQLLSNLMLFFTKEGFRKVALRQEPDQAQSSVNLGWMGTGCCWLVVGPLAAYWLHTAPLTASWTYQVAIFLMVLASCCEALAEPFVLLTLSAQDFQRRAAGEALAIVARTVGMLLFTLALDDVPLAFAASQMIYALVWLAWFAWPIVTKGVLWKPAAMPSGWISEAHKSLLVEFGGMVILKLCLTEGEKMLLLALFEERQWGVFGLVSNLGSIVLRLLFAPTEEIAYSVFSAEERSRSFQLAMLRGLLLLQGGIGWLGLCFGPSFSPIAVRLLYGPDWAASEAPQVLAAYCVFLFFAALNGVLEAFMYAQCSPSWVRYCNLWHLGISLVLVLVSWAGQAWGPVALVAANASAMCLRSLLGLVFAARQLRPSWSELRLAPVCQLLGLLALGSRLSAWLVPSVVDVWRVSGAVLLAALVIAVSALLGRRELWAALQAVRSSKAT